ncbi:MAG TPA: urea ABC transporter permease subunit UrtB [Nocardioides sp.]|jgi:urea transport system permease protein|uniref:urea ABC transporter permease subunit UrtB n=1 Tax=Nocardioides sp. TaxID=35761 RepID=UPI002B94123C|nr:urea ABC transporter permease subunit UrtB [Nocardioides sp.]HTW15939.1 urea ABC transporter permease subunit UrtB [Nocardioides sp.]
MESFTTPLLTGTSTAAILLLAALGLALTFGQMGVINMAHGEFLMAGAYTTYLTQQVVTSADLSLLVAIPVAFLVTGLLGLALEAGIIRWMYARPLDTLLVTVGVSMILQQLAKDLFGAQGDPVHEPGWLDGSVAIAGYNWPYTRIFTIVLAAAALAGLSALLRYSRFGRQIRATVQNRDLAETMGVSTRRVDRITFFVGSGLAGIGGVALSLASGTNPTLGTSYIIPAFLVVVAGGLGQLKGTVIAAWLVGVSTAFLTDRFSGSTAQVVTFALVVIFLQVRPQGLFTVRTRGLA